MKILLVAINAKYIHSNLAIYDLQAYAREYGTFSAAEMDISFREFTINHSLDYILQELYQEKADVICFSCYIWNIDYVEHLVKELKCLAPNTDLWLGGPEVSYDAQERNRRFPQLTGIMCGECVTQQILAAENMVDMSRIPFPYGNYETSDGMRRLVPNELLENLRNRIIYYESSRGCPFSCSYCLSSVDKKLRFRDLELVKEELQFFIDQRVKQVKFVDRTFNCKKSHGLEIWKYILEHDEGETNFHFEIGADLLGEDELEVLSRMRPGLVQLEIGIQSTNADTIHEINRKMNLDKLKMAVNRIRDMQNINLHVDLIAGLPYENLESFQESFNEVYKLYAEQLQLGFLKVLKGSAMELKQQEYGIAHKSYAPYEVLYTNWLSYEDVLSLKMVEEMVENYYNSGQFTYTLRYIENDFESPFKLYYELGKYYEAHYDKMQKHARIERYHILRDFMKEWCGKEKTVLNELCIFDIYLRENMKSRPGFASEVQSFRQIFRYVSGTCGLDKNEHLEYLSAEVWNILQDMNVSYEEKECEYTEDMKEMQKQGNVLVYFDYEKRNPLNHNGTVCKVVEKC